MTRFIEAAVLEAWLGDGGELALLDVREHGQYGESHLFHAIPLPYSRLELDLERLVPRKATRVVMYDDGAAQVAELAARRAGRLGYVDVHVLSGGSAAWQSRGHGLFAGVNVPSKAFGELLEQVRHTPRVTAPQLHAMMERGEDFVVVDGRPWAEYRKMSIPGGLCCPNAELALRIGRIAPDPATTVVVNCAGRTRSIVGAQTLIDFGVPNRVVALENGTQGWMLAGLELEHGASRQYPPAPEGAERERLRSSAERMAERFGIPRVAAAEASRWLEDPGRTTYLLDVRTQEEFDRGSLPGARHAPGGQLVQATDAWIGVRGARLVLLDDDGVRAIPTAMWLRQMGHDAHVLEQGLGSGLASAPHPAARHDLPELAEAAPSDLEQALLLDLRPSMAYRQGHLEHAVWSIRPRLAPTVRKQTVTDREQPVVLIAENPLIARAAALDLAELGVQDIRYLPSRRMQGLPQAATPDSPADDDCIDFLFFTHGRHDGDRAAAIQYLNWETGLLRQLSEAELATYRIPGRSSPSASLS